MLARFSILFLSFLFAHAFGVFAKDSDKKHQNFEIPVSTLEALDRKLKIENDQQKRIQLILRWIKAKEEFEQSKIEREKAATQKKPSISAAPESVSGFKAYKEAIVERLKKEVGSLETHQGLRLDPIYHVLAFRLLELQRYKEALEIFGKLTGRTADDWMGIGDAYFSLNDTANALDAYEHAGLALKYRNTAAYKRAWCFLQRTEYSKALLEFDIALEDNSFSSLKLREEAFRDRLRPYVETFAKPSFDEEEMNRLRALANRVHPSEIAKSKELFSIGLKTLIENFNAKAQVRFAQSVFSYLTKEFSDSMSVLVVAAPLWIKVYRGQLNHEEVEKIVTSLPAKKIEGLDTSRLQAELYNSAVFYDTLFKEDKLPATRKILFDVNKKFFLLFPDEATGDPLRVSYAKLLLEDGDPSECIQVLSRRKGMEKEVEEHAISLDAKCQLKQLDQLYQLEHDEFFYAKLKQALIERKIYERTDLGLSSEQAFDSLARMLIGALNKNTQMAYLREILSRLISNYPYPRESKLYRDLEILMAELEFADIVQSKAAADDRSDRFYEVYQKAPKGAEVSQKALLNSIIVGRAERVLSRCEVFAKTDTADFIPGKDAFDHCIKLAERYLDLKTEYAFWYQAEALLKEPQLLKLGLIELALGKIRGKKRLQGLKTNEAKAALELWDGPVAAKPVDRANPKLDSLREEVKVFLSSLKPVSFQKIKATVPARIKAFEAADGQLVKYYKSKPGALAMAETLELRAEMAIRMRNWVKALPEPIELSPQDLAIYQKKSAEFSQTWEQGAEKRIHECGEVAHSLTVDFKVNNLEACPDKALPETYDEILKKWEASRQRAPAEAPWTKEDTSEKGVTVEFLLEAGGKAKSREQAKYFFIRAADLSTSDYDRARSYLSLAKLSDKEGFWESAHALDGNLAEPIQRLRKKAEGNPFFVTLYDKMLSELK